MANQAPVLWWIGCAHQELMQHPQSMLNAGGFEHWGVEIVQIYFEPQNREEAHLNALIRIILARALQNSFKSCEELLRFSGNWAPGAERSFTEASQLADLIGAIDPLTAYEARRRLNALQSQVKELIHTLTSGGSSGIACW